MSKIALFALHGFLGKGSDWDSLRDGLAQEDVSFYSPDLLSKESFFKEALCFTKFAASFKEYFSERKAEKNILIGYSMGGRLAAHVMNRMADEFDCVYILSANPGFIDSSSIESRREFELNWAQKIESLPWAEFIEQWNKQGIFDQNLEQVFQRKEKNYSSVSLARCFTQLGVSLQLKDYNLVKGWKNKAHWWVGSKDQKYKSIYEAYREKKLIDDYQIIPQVGHRFLKKIPCDLNKSILESIYLLKENQ